MPKIVDGCTIIEDYNGDTTESPFDKDGKLIFPAFTCEVEDAILVARDLWYKFVATDSFVSLSTCGSTADAVDGGELDTVMTLYKSVNGLDCNAGDLSDDNLSWSNLVRFVCLCACRFANKSTHEREFGLFFFFFAVAEIHCQQRRHQRQPERGCRMPQQ